MDILKTDPLYLGGALLCVALVTYIYAGITNPLSHIPGPWYTRFSTLPSVYMTLRAHHPLWIHDLHAKYGPVVRFSPHEVDVSDPQAMQHINAAKTGFLKSPWYTKLVTDTSSVFNETNPDIHRKYRRLLSNPMSETGLKAFLPRIDNKVRFAISCICDENKVRGAADVAKWFMFLSFDVIGDLTFGESFGNLERGEKNQSVTDFVSLGYVSSLRTTFPFIAFLSRFIPIPVFKDATKIQYRTLNYSQGAIDRHAKLVEESGSDINPTVFSKVYNAGQEDTWTSTEIRDNAHVFIVGGSDTTANSMIYLVWAVCKHPEIKAKLLDELDGLPEDYTYEDLRELKYLNCIVDETLRLYTALPCCLPRTVPPGGAVLAGKFIPSGFTVATQAYSLHRNEEAYPDPFRFYPERWEHPTQLMKDCSMPFGGGSRSCLGRHLGRIELRLITARFFKAFPKATISDLEGMCEKDMVPALYFLMVPGGHRCLISLDG
ncbi:cytochrome P450 [Colletotrichum zoysiae]|uniref:Cytochrome P450 n=1 Tax=Colletotrichum zoysiae TaxID=1216348 RepID=A0AAD9H5E5_9PEZI|nr:cytochrome P450 [Colletotrichum zoysiae]